MPRLANQARQLFYLLSNREKEKLTILLILSAFAAISEIITVGLLLPILTVLSSPSVINPTKNIPFISTVISVESSTQLLSILLPGFAFFTLASTVLRLFIIKYQTRLTATISSNLATQVFRTTLERPLEWHFVNNTSYSIGLLTKDVEQLSLVIQALLLGAVNLIIVIALLIALLVISGKTVIFFALLLGLLYFLLYRFTKNTLLSDGHQLSMNYKLSLQSSQEAMGSVRDVLLSSSITVC